MSQTPRDRDFERAAQLLRSARERRDVRDRMDWFSKELVGAPYTVCPLGGSSSEPEIFTALLSGFDCVTYVETVLALAISRTVSTFVANLRSIRYRGGEVSWHARNHYMSAWIRENEDAGFVRNETRGPGVVTRARRLTLVPGLPSQDISVASIRKSAFVRRLKEVETGDLVFFVSTRRNLDVFHCGVLAREGEEVHLRHAARSRGRVVEQSLTEFLHENRMTGIILISPSMAFSRAA